MGIDTQGIRVFKFGGASLAQPEGFRNVARIVAAHTAGSLVVVVSALGKTTNLLEQILYATLEETSQDGSLYEELYNIHRDISLELMNVAFFDTEIAPVLRSLRDKLETIKQEATDEAYDQVVSFGELLSSRILAGLLADRGLNIELIDASEIIRTDDTWRDARVNWKLTESAIRNKVWPILDQGKVVLTQGFLGGEPGGQTTTLGREGSDYSGAILAYSLDALSLTIWKDVPGILSADPKQFANPIAIDRLSFLEAIEMTYYGAKVIHPKTIKPLQNKNIPLWVRSFNHPELPGSLIFSEIGGFYPPVVVLEKDQILLQISTTDFSFVAERHLAHIFQCLDKYRVKVNLMRNSAINFSVCVSDPGSRLDPLLEALKEEFDIRIDQHLELITIRHYDQPTIDRMKQGKLVLLEESIRETYQMVVKAVPPIRRLDNS